MRRVKNEKGKEKIKIVDSFSLFIYYTRRIVHVTKFVTTQLSRDNYEKRKKTRKILTHKFLLIINFRGFSQQFSLW